MAYISTQKAAEIRSKLKEEFPEIKFSVALSSGKHALNVSIMKAPYEFRPVEFESKPCVDINQYWLDSPQFAYRNVDILERIISICNEGNWDRSDAMVDYFDVGWYLHLSVGQWNKPFELVAPKKTRKANNKQQTESSYTL